MLAWWGQELLLWEISRSDVAFGSVNHPSRDTADWDKKLVSKIQLQVRRLLQIISWWYTNVSKRGNALLHPQICLPMGTFWQRQRYRSFACSVLNGKLVVP